MACPVEVASFGCRLNMLEGDVIRRAADAAGCGNVLVVNSCAVTSEAVRQVRQAIRRAKRADPALRIVVTGCAAQTEPDTFRAMSEVDLIVGNRAKAETGTWADARAALGEPAAPDLRPGAGVPRTGMGASRGFVAVQTGCDHACTFCIIPQGRGPSRSTPPAEVVAEVRRLVEAGRREVVLTGVDLTSYGDGCGELTLGRLVRTILAEVPELERLRLSSIDAAEADGDLLAALAVEQRLMPHLHLSLQAGDDLVLKRMKRRHSRAGALAFIAELRRLRPGIVLGADLIAGFPTETEEQARATRAFALEAGLAFLNVFPFSARAGTPAALMPQVPAEVVAERSRRLRAVGAHLLHRHLSREVGAVRRVLAEAGDGGYTEHFTPVRLVVPVAQGKVAAVRIVGHDGRRLIAGAMADETPGKTRRIAA